MSTPDGQDSPRRADDPERAGLDPDWFALLYRELHALAARMEQRGATTLQATALVHEAYLRTASAGPREFRDRDHFVAYAATAMRHALLDHIRDRRRLKRSPVGEAQFAEFLIAPEDEVALDVERLDALLDEMAQFNPDMARGIELRFFGGASVEEAARILGLPQRTFERRWRAARAWLCERLS